MPYSNILGATFVQDPIQSHLRNLNGPNAAGMCATHQIRGTFTHVHKLDILIYYVRIQVILR